MTELLVAVPVADMAKVESVMTKVEPDVMDEVNEGVCPCPCAGPCPRCCCWMTPKLWGIWALVFTMGDAKGVEDAVEGEVEGEGENPFLNEPPMLVVVDPAEKCSLSFSRDDLGVGGRSAFKDAAVMPLP